MAKKTPEPAIRSISDLTALNEWYRTSLAMLRPMPTKLVRQVATNDLRKALKKIEAMVDEAERLEHITATAREVYDRSPTENREIQIVGDMTHHNGNSGREAGYWVDAWLWVPDKEERAREDADE